MTIYRCCDCGKIFPEEELKEYHEDCTPGYSCESGFEMTYKGCPVCGGNCEDYEEEEEEEE